MDLLIFKTDISTTQRLLAVSPLLENHPSITDWSIDLEDIDKVLRVSTVQSLEEEELIQLLIDQGVNCETLPDFIPQ